MKWTKGEAAWTEMTDVIGKSNCITIKGAEIMTLYTIKKKFSYLIYIATSKVTSGMLYIVSSLKASELA